MTQELFPELVNLLENFSKDSCERKQMLALLKSASKVIVSDNASKSIMKTIENNPEDYYKDMSILASLKKPVWFEYNDKPRGGDLLKIGVLLSPYPDSSPFIMMATAWKMKDETLHHSYSFGRIDIEKILKNTEVHPAEIHSVGNHSVENHSEIVDKIFQTIQLHIPEDLAEETELWTDSTSMDKKQRELNIKMDVMSEYIFIIGCFLLYISKEAVLVKDERADCVCCYITLDVKPSRKRGFLRRLWGEKM